ncbi:AMP-binding protein [Yinghuangia soli]|uniref:Long-chain fatty acid--CoA ligase n=1 Tax=Yinghuangia soli TaxID=2908204 RepID=A0AA41TYU5_9ACTN|nr:AMP-binding protein [Yinghuangia soli]MCF2526801.1 long-chain fatty acid--CoA ligase [Yinghuangia soli]
MEHARNLLASLWRAADHWPERLAAYRRGPAGPEDRALTWRQLEDRVVAVAAGLMAGGVLPGDRIGVMVRPCVEWTVLDLAVLAAGAATVPMPPGQGIAACHRALRGTAPRMVFVEGPADAMTVARATGGAADPPQEMFVLREGGLQVLTSWAEPTDRDAVRPYAERVATSAVALFDRGAAPATHGPARPLTHAEVGRAALRLGTLHGVSGPRGTDPGRLPGPAVTVGPLHRLLPHLMQFAALEAGRSLAFPGRPARPYAAAG